MVTIKLFCNCLSACQIFKLTSLSHNVAVIMILNLGDHELDLLENQPLGLSRAAGHSLLCTAGQLWITESGHYDDQFLNPGEAYLVASDALVLIEAVGKGKLQIMTRRQLVNLTGEHGKKPTLLDEKYVSWFNSRLLFRKGG